MDVKKALTKTLTKRREKLGHIKLRTSIYKRTLIKKTNMHVTDWNIFIIQNIPIRKCPEIKIEDLKTHMVPREQV